MEKLYAESPLVRNVYESNENYKIIDTPTNNCKLKNKLCAVYFSSNSLYYPDEEKAFIETIIQKDRYEWFATRIKAASKHIFIRDVQKQWYVKGINKRLNSPDKLKDWLKTETEGYDIVMVGSSAGAYIAILLGCLLKVKMVFAFSPQFDLCIQMKQSPGKWPNLHEMYSTPVRDYYDINNVLTEDIPIYYFYPSDDWRDQEHFAMVKNKEKLRIIEIHKVAHGTPFGRESLEKVINFNTRELEKLVGVYDSPRSLEIKMYGALNYWLYYVRSQIQRVLRKLLLTKSRTA